MTNTGAPLGQAFKTSMPAYTDNADIQRAFMMLWYGDPNADTPTTSGLEYFLTSIDNDINVLTARKSTNVTFSNTAPVRNTDDYSSWIWVDTSVFNSDGASRPIKIWSGDQWSVVAGAADPSLNYVWTGAHTFNDVLIKNAINPVASSNDRTSKLAGAPNGTLSFINNRYEYLRDGSWTPLGNMEKTIENRNTTAVNMSVADADKFLQFNAAQPTTYTVTDNAIRIGTSIYVSRNADTPLSIVPVPGVTLVPSNIILGKNASATLIKTGTNTWTVQGGSSALPPGGSVNQVLAKTDSSDYATQWLSVVPASGGTFTGQVNFAEIASGNATVGTINVNNSLTVASGNAIIGGRRIFVQPTQPTTMSDGDVWIQS